MLKAIHAQGCRSATQEKAEVVISEPRRQNMTRAAELVAESTSETLSFDAFPDSHWIKIRTNNPPEWIKKEIRRRMKVVGVFPERRSCFNLAAARLKHIARTQWPSRRYMNMDPLYAEQTPTSEAAALQNARKTQDTTLKSEPKPPLKHGPRSPKISDDGQSGS